MLKTIGKLFRDYKPLMFFSIIAVILLILSAAFFIPVFHTYLQTGTVPHYPTLIVCGFAATAGILSFFSGMILESIRQKDKRDFEMTLNTIHNRYTVLLKEHDTEKNEKANRS